MKQQPGSMAWQEYTEQVFKMFSGELEDVVIQFSNQIKLGDIRASDTFDVSCQGSVPLALEAFSESTSFEDAIRNAIFIGGDSDTIAAITGGIAEAYYGIPADIRKLALTFLDAKQLEIRNAFESRYGLVLEKDAGKGITRAAAPWRKAGL